MNGDRSLGVVIPAYQPDTDVLKQYAKDIHARLEPDCIRIELDSASKDTVRSLEELPAEISVSRERRGKGAAITHGFDNLDTEVLCFVDADASTPIESVRRVIAPVLERQADLSIGSRGHPDSRIKTHQSKTRQFLGRRFTEIANQLLDTELYDYQCGAKAIDSDVWGDLSSYVSQDGFAWDLELVALADTFSYSITEIPIEWNDHPSSSVPIIRTSYELMYTLLSYSYRSKFKWSKHQPQSDKDVK